MRENWLEEGLRDKFEGFDSELNLEEAWGELEEKRNEPSKRRLGWLWIVAGSLFFLGSATTIYQLSSNEIIGLTDALVTTVVSNAIPPGQVVVSDIKNVSPSEKTTEQESQFESSSKGNSQKKQLETLVANTQISTNRLVNNAYESFSTPRHKTQTSQNKLITVDQAIIPNSSSIIRQSATVASTKSEINNITFLAGVTSTLQRDSRQEFNIKFADFPIQDRVKKSKSVPQFVGLDFAFSPVTTGKVLADEEALDAISTSLYYKKHLSNRFYLKAGLGLDRYTTRQKGNSEFSFTTTEPNQIVSRIFYDNGTVDNILGDGEVTTTETTDYQLYNSYQFITIPVIAGFRIIDRDHTSIELEGGMSTTISSQYDVKEYDPTNNGQVNQLADLNLRNTSIFSGLLAAQWNYHPKSLNRLGIFMKVGTRFQLNDISADDQYNLEKLRSYQLGLGLQYRL